MQWLKRGVAYCPDGNSTWAKHSALQPTPLVLNDDVIRLYLGFRDDAGTGRVGYVDVRASNPSDVLRISESPCLDIGAPGAFDADGVVPCAVVKRGDRIFLYYAGYLQAHSVRFIAFGGLAVSEDGGDTFVRHSTVPITERTEDEFLFRVIHSILPDGDRWRVWYGAGSSFKAGSGKTLPHYNIRYMESDDGFTFPTKGRVALHTEGEEYRVGRPYVVQRPSGYVMFFGMGSEAEPYRLGYAESADALNWVRKHDLGLDLSPTGWDSQMMAYPAFIEVRGKAYLFYNGNDYGRTGVGYAELLRW